MVRTVLFLLIFPLSLFAQTTWYFGNGAGIEFTSSGIKPVSGGKIFTNEGCSAAYDGSGNLLFYTDGRSVWSKDHELFKNGEGLNGNFSATQSAMAVPKPGDKNSWFIFTADTLAGNKGICYSVANVDARKIEEKNRQLLSRSSEKLAATFHANGKDYWLLAHEWNSNKFYAFPVTEKGIGTPVISQAGAVHKETGAGRNREAIGEMKFSADGTRLAAAICYRNEDNLEIFDFDSSTGNVSNARAIPVNGYPYGLCFSPGSSKLYVSFLKGKSGIIQYDLAAKEVSEIVKNESENSFGSMQEGPDGKIYVARNSNFLDVISFPDKDAVACGYTGKAIDVSPGHSAFGLPAFVPQKKFDSPTSVYDKCASVVVLPFSKKEFRRTAEIVTCEDNYLLDAKNFGASYDWSNYATTRTISVDTSGLYKVMVRKDGCVIVDSVMLRFKKDMAVFRYLPKFDPESDFLNPEFLYSIEEVSGFELKIYDSKKKLVFETLNKEQKWNGRNLKGELVAAGEYTWKVAFTPNCPKGSKQVMQEGRVTVVRNKK